MKLLLENWRQYLNENMEIDEESIKTSILSLLPHAEIQRIEVIGSSALSSEEQYQQDLEKYGYEQEERDVDIKVYISGVTNEEIEEWAFSEQAQELEDVYNYDVQMEIDR
jgi:hypothetical protein|tara:strand:- start:1686 stop:2015 length:330 start_codon:yes stop_codon:yes gene_type:complete